MIRLYTGNNETFDLSAKKPTRVAPDVLVSNEDTIFVFCPLTAAAKEWIDEHVQPDAKWFGNALIVDHRFAWGLAQGMIDDGLKLQ